MKRVKEDMSTQAPAEAIPTESEIQDGAVAEAPVEESDERIPAPRPFRSRD